MSKRSRRVWIIAVVALIALALLANGLGETLADGLRRMHAPR